MKQKKFKFELCFDWEMYKTIQEVNTSKTRMKGTELKKECMKSKEVERILKFERLQI